MPSATIYYRASKGFLALKFLLHRGWTHCSHQHFKLVAKVGTNIASE